MDRIYLAVGVILAVAVTITGVALAVHYAVTMPPHERLAVRNWFRGWAGKDPLPEDDGTDPEGPPPGVDLGDDTTVPVRVAPAAASPWVAPERASAQLSVAAMVATWDAQIRSLGLAADEAMRAVAEREQAARRRLNELYTRGHARVPDAA